MKERYFISIIAMIFALCFITASQSSLKPVEAGTCIELQQTCSNCSYINLSSVIYPNNTFALRGEYSMIKDGNTYSYNFCNTDALGGYIYCVHGDANGIDDVTPCIDFEVTPNGEEVTVGKAVFYIGLLIMLMIFLIGCVTLFMKNDSLLAKVGFFGLGYLLLIAITFIAWNMAGDFLTSSAFLVSMFRILFFVLIVGAFPLLIGSFIYYFIMVTKIKEIERLMTKGFSEEEAGRRVSKR